MFGLFLSRISGGWYGHYGFYCDTLWYDCDSNKDKKNLIFVTYFLGNCTAFVAPSTQILFLKNILFYNRLLGDAAYLKNCEFFH